MWKGYRYGVESFPKIEWIADSKCGQSQFLTIISIIASMVAMALALLADIPGLKSLRKLQRPLLAITLPVSCIVTLIYWSLLIFIPSLIIPAESVQLDPSLDLAGTPQVLPESTRLPLAHDFLLHVVPTAAQILDFLLFHRSYPKRTLSFSAPIVHAIAGICYAFFIEFHCSVDGTYPYPFLAIAPSYVRIIIYVAATLLSIVSLRFLNGLHSLLINSKEQKQA